MPSITLQFDVSQEIIDSMTKMIVHKVQESNAHQAVPVNTPQPAAAPAQQTGPELDEDRVPWNGEFHASTKTKKNDGTWKLKKGVDKDAMEKWKDDYHREATKHIEAREVTQNPEDRQDPANPEVSVPQVPQAAPAPAPAPTVEPAEIPPFLQRNPETNALPPQPAPVPVPQPAPTPEPAVQMPTPQPIAAPVTPEAMMAAYEGARDRVGDATLGQYLTTIYTNAGIADPANPQELTTNETMRASVAAQFTALGTGAPNDLMVQPQAPA